MAVACWQWKSCRKVRTLLGRYEEDLEEAVLSRDRLGRAKQQQQSEDDLRVAAVPQGRREIDHLQLVVRNVDDAVVKEGVHEMRSGIRLLTEEAAGVAEVGQHDLMAVR